MSADRRDKVTFYDPHPGSMGAAIPLPERIRKVAAGLDGQTMTLPEALSRFRAVTNGKLKIIAEHKYIMLRLKSKTPEYVEHGFRLIKYR